MPDIELWGGHECTVNRVGDRFQDQTRLSGHQDRLEDLELFAGLGLKALRYPVLWERIAPDTPQDRDWSWTDERLAEIDRLGMRPIAGLLHHGSGPAYTSLVSENFVALFAAHARAAAERYPWVEDWTPINEPLTTARFSALYGHWYPHARDEPSFWTALLNQIEGVAAAMREIRAVNPAARLVQTEDLGQTHSTSPLADQASFENHRRWLTWDLLCGQVDHDHPFWPRLKRFGLTDRVKAITADPCPPDVIGVNYYLTSERFLDHRIERYPVHRIGGNAFVRYADVEAVRVLNPGPVGLQGLMQQAWERYRIPLAVTESHNGCTREEQMRWVWETWRTGADPAGVGSRRPGGDGLGPARQPRLEQPADQTEQPLRARPLRPARRRAAAHGRRRHAGNHRQGRRSAPGAGRRGLVAARRASRVPARHPHGAGAGGAAALDAGGIQPAADPDRRRDRHARPGAGARLRVARAGLCADRPRAARPGRRRLAFDANSTGTSPGL